MYGISTEDMDSLTFGTPKLIRHLMAPASQKTPVTEFDYQQVGSMLGECAVRCPLSAGLSSTHASAAPPTLLAACRC